MGSEPRESDSEAPAIHGGEPDESVTVIIPSHNRRHILERTMACYQALEGHPSIIVIDDGSTDDTTAWLRSLGVATVRIPTRRGLPHARNVGLQLARTEWVFFGEDDVILPKNHLTQLLQVALDHPKYSALAGQLFPGVDWNLPVDRPASTHKAMWDDLCLANFSYPIHAISPQPSLHACALIKRANALSVGGYDIAYTDSAFREESDFYARMWKAGYPCALTPATWAIHVRHRLGGGARGNKDIRSKIANRYSYWRGNTRFLNRHWMLFNRFLRCPARGLQKYQHALRIIQHDLRAIGIMR